MHFHQVLNDGLGCASYLLADRGEAIVVDPRWDIAVYVQLARSAGARIVHVLETHDHADHVSGRERLARETGAVALRPSAALEPGAVLRAGRIRLTALATPGHRPEHLAFAVADESRSDEPWAVLTGDSLLVGDVARPDLAVEPRDGARALHGSLQRLFALGDHVEVWPGHIGGSLCGGAGLSSKTSSTIGFERRANGPAALTDREAFVDAVVAATPTERPPHLARVVELNRGSLAEPTAPVLVDPALLAQHVARGTTILDIRPPAEFDAGYLPGSLNVPPVPGRVTRVGWAVEPDEPLLVVARTCDEARAFAGELHAIGLWDVEGVVAADAFVWSASGIEVQQSDSWTLESLAAALVSGSVDLVDVRGPQEWAAGHVPGSAGVPLDALGNGRGRFRRSNDDAPIAVACAAGGRAALGASLLRRAGYDRVYRVAGGGIDDLPEHGVDLEQA